jgi:hypothetical protein
MTGSALSLTTQRTSNRDKIGCSRVTFPKSDYADLERTSVNSTLAEKGMVGL